jgi:hypothetical protein
LSRLAIISIITTSSAPKLDARAILVPKVSRAHFKTSWALLLSNSSASFSICIDVAVGRFCEVMYVYTEKFRAKLLIIVVSAVHT